MATAAVQHAQATVLGHVVEPLAQEYKPAKHNVTAELFYYNDPGDGSPPAPAYVGKPDTFVRPRVSQNVLIHDISGDENKYTLDTQGFQYVKHESKEKDFDDDDKIKAEYYPEVEQLLKDSTGASRVFIFDHTIRRAVADVRDVAGIRRGPARLVHIDQSYGASVQRVKYHLPDEADELLSKRFQIINVWRPIKTIRRDPLALADARSVPETDLVAAKLIYPNREGETFAVKPNPSHQWYFKYGQRPDEPLFIKCYDSVEDGRARRIPHTSFVDPAHENDAPRESIECLQQSDCILVERHRPLDCLAPPLLYTLPEPCQQLKRGFSDCKRGMIDMRKRFRGNQPISTSAELEGGSGAGKDLLNSSGGGGGSAAVTAVTSSQGKPHKQLYAGKPAFDLPLKEGARGEVPGLGFDESKTRGL
ncbi:hypothetical protein DV738_g1035, partial [Chaetothyriales sp. CBS 135597]